MKLNLEVLTKLVDEQEKDTFYYKDFQHPDGGASYRIFNYRLASFQDFKANPMLLWCRGVMFNLETGLIASRPMEKFFNYHEWSNNSTKLPKSKYWNIHTKHDGSLVSTYIHEGQVYLKSKFSLESEQAVRATELYREMYKGAKPNELRTLLRGLSASTANFEYVAPDNIIVVPYAKPNILPLNVIDNETGKYSHAFSTPKVHESILDEWVNEVYDDNETLHEGYVLESQNGKTRFKVKTNRYLAAHRVKDDISSTKKMIELVATGNIDDLLTSKDLSQDDAFFQLLLAKSERFKDIMNNCISNCETFHDAYRHNTRKDFAITAQEQNMPLGLVMNLYLNKEPDYLSYFLRNKELFENE